jgi:bacterial/archaeal transporter family protein
MWILFALLSALFAGITTILAKLGIKNTDSYVATAIRTVVVLVFSWLMVFVVGSQNTIGDISIKSIIFLVLSGITTGFSWICYFRSLQLGDVNKVVPIDKSSTLLTMLLAFIFLGEKMTLNKVMGMIGIGVGTYLMIQKKETNEDVNVDNKWLIYALLSAVFAGLTSILGKIGIENVESNLGTAIRTIVVLIVAWGIVFWLSKVQEIKKIDRRSWIFILLSGFTTGLSWLSYYHALKYGLAGIVVPMDKLSIVVTIAFAYIFLKEKLSLKATLGLVLLIICTLLLLLNF